MIIPLLSLIFCSLLGWAQDELYLLAGKEILVPKLGSKQALTAHPRFEGFIQEMFNRQGDFHGPNCYNTALIANGYFSKTSKRYVSPEEFEEILKSNFVKVTAPAFQDIIVFDARSSRGHAAFYLGDDLIFHKKSFGTQYHYRITDIDHAGAVEENEWAPGPADDSSQQMKWPELGSLPKEYYRRNSIKPMQLDKRLAPLVTKIEQALLPDLGSWAIGKKWGMTGEYLLEDLVKYGQTLKTDKYTAGLLTSLKDQVFIMIEEVYFKRARSASRVMEEICIPEQKEQLFGLIRETGKLLGRDSQKIETVLTKLDAQDKSRCQLRPLDELLK
jgi:hypothetical protein